MPTPRVTIVSASIGAGHDGAARELGRRLAGLGFDVTRLDFLDLLPGRLGAALRRTYAAELAVAPRTWGWLLRVLDGDRVASVAADVAGRVAGVRTQAALGVDTSVVVSTYPLASQVLGQLRASGALRAPVVTFLTDMSVHRLWVAAGVDVHLALHDVAVRDAARHGARAQLVRAAVDPTFHPHATVGEWSRTRARHGIPGDRPAALVVAGSWGVGEVEAAMLDIAASGVACPIAVCGANTRLYQRIRDSGAGLALGWVDDMAALMRASDVVVQNAGGLTSLEAMACGVPVVSYRSIAGHGRDNNAALEEAGLATWARDRTGLAPLLRQAIATPRPHRPLRPTGEDPAEVIAALAESGTRPGVLLPVGAGR